MGQVRDAAHQLRDLGFSVVPLQPREKLPLIQWAEFQKRHATHDEIDQWFDRWPDANLALVCGAISGVAAIDADSPEAVEWMRTNLPSTTVVQKTAKGYHRFYATNGQPIPNKVSIVKGVDVRGDGGYVVIAPSIHPSGHEYTLSLKHGSGGWADLTPFPVEKLTHRPIQACAPHSSGVGYAQSAFGKEMAALASAGPGTRNTRLNTAAFNLGQLVGGGELDRATVRAALLGVATSIGLDPKEADKTVESGLAKGEESPRSAPKDPEYMTDDSANSANSANSAISVSVSHVQPNQPNSDMAEKGTFIQEQDGGIVRVSSLVKNWIMNSKGSFFSVDLDREFGFSTRAEKKARANAITYMAEKGYIEIDNYISSKYHIIHQSDLEEVEWDAPHEEEFPVRLPLGISDLAAIGPRSLILVEGCTNAGKTLFGLHSLAENLPADYPLWYLFSEGSPGEIIRRLRPNVNWDAWKKKVRAAPRAGVAHQVIKAKARDGLTVIDYIEARDGKYYEIAPAVSKIWDALGNGVAVILLQKKSGADFAMGGEQVRHKPRLVMTMDYMHLDEAFSVIRLKIRKCKTPKVDGKNPDGKEIHVGVSYGWRMHILKDWHRSAAAERGKALPGYIEEMHQLLGLTPAGKPALRKAAWAYQFTLADGKEVGITWDQLKQWKDAFAPLDVDKVLARLSTDSKHSEFLKQNWIFQIAGVLSADLARMGAAETTDCPF